MTIEATTCQVSEVANGQKTIFNFNFLIPEGAMRVYMTENNVAVMVPSDEYTVSGFGNSGGGFVTFTVAPSAGQIITIRRYLNPTQTTDLLPPMTTYVNAVEAVLDRHAMVMQQLQCDLGRTVKAPVGSEQNTDQLYSELLGLSAKLNEYLRCDDNLSSLTDVSVARNNLNVYAKNEVYNRSEIDTLPKAYDIPWLAGAGTDLVGEDLKIQPYGRVVLARDFIAEDFIAHLDVAPTGADLVLDIQANGVSIWSKKPKFADGRTVLTPGVLDPAVITCAAGTVLMFSVAQVGTVVPGQNLVVTLKGREA